MSRILMIVIGNRFSLGLLNRIKQPYVLISLLLLQLLIPFVLKICRVLILELKLNLGTVLMC